VARRIVPNLVADVPQEGAEFFTQVLGLERMMDLGFIVTYASPSNAEAQLSILSQDPSGMNPDYSVEVADVDEAFASALRQDCEIVYSLRDEPWGVRRFFVRDPTGALANVLAHKERAAG
jgi:catechol 2,3-dioxygenase-like lactoylglutathione lyase family enzyme